MSATLNWPQQSTGGACQSNEMAAVLNSLSFVFKNLFLPKGPATRNDFVNDIVDDARADAIFATLKTIVDVDVLA